MSEPTADEIARWHDDLIALSHETILAGPAATNLLTAVPRLLALVAAQAEQIAELDARCDEMGAAVAWSDLSDERVAHIAEGMRESRFEDLWQEAEGRAERAEAVVVRVGAVEVEIRNALRTVQRQGIDVLSTTEALTFVGDQLRAALDGEADR